ncbi:MAG: CoB--CoM heterodisulfide reductase subunit C [Candidatus Jordarchaeaceae archaeon]
MAEDQKIIRKTDPHFIEEIIQYGSKYFPKEEMERLKACISCGTCVGSCPSGRRTAWRIRKIFRKAQLGLKEDALKDDELWSCTTCYTCFERCPRRVPTTDAVRVIRNLAFRSGVANPRHLAVCGYLFKFGHAVPINDETRAVRKKIGLDELPATVHKFPEGLKEVNMLVEETGFKKVVEADQKEAQSKEAQKVEKK